MPIRKARIGLFSISDFAKYSGVSKDTLIHYTNIGLLTPSTRDDNNYRYYSSEHLAVVNVIRTMQSLGLTLQEIKELKDRRTPQGMIDLFERQGVLINQKIEEWIQAEKLLETLSENIRHGLNIDEDSVSIQFLTAEAIVLGGLNDYSRGKNEYDALRHFYQAMEKTHPGLNMNFPVWGLFYKERIQAGDWDMPDRYYFRNPDGRDKRPAGLYAIGYARGGYGQNDELYRRILNYINQNGFVISGNSYEEYPLNEISITDPEHYLMRIMVSVSEK